MAILKVTEQLYNVISEAAGSEDRQLMENVVRNYMGLEHLKAPDPHDVHATKYPFRSMAVKTAIKWPLNGDLEEQRNVKKYLNGLKKYGQRFQTRVWMGCLEVTRIF